MFVSPENLDTIVEAAKLENVNTTFVLFGKKDGYLSIDEVISDQSDEEVKAFKSVEISDLKNTPACIQKGIKHYSVYSYETYVLSYVWSPWFWKNARILYYLLPSSPPSIELTLASIVNIALTVIPDHLKPKKTLEIIDKYKVSTKLF